MQLSSPDQMIPSEAWGRTSVVPSPSFEPPVSKPPALSDRVDPPTYSLDEGSLKIYDDHWAFSLEDEEKILQSYLRAPRPARWNLAHATLKVEAHPVSYAKRFAEVAQVLLRPLFGMLLDARGSPGGEVVRMRAAEMREALTSLGPAYVKMGQLLSTRPDLLPSEWLEELSKLQDEMPTFPTEGRSQYL